MTSFLDFWKAFVSFLAIFMCSFGCSVVPSHRDINNFGRGFEIYRLQNDPVKLEIYHREIIPWLINHGLFHYDIINLNLDLIHLHTPSSFRIPELFKNTDLVMELCSVLLSNQLTELATSLLKFAYFSIFHSFTYNLLIRSLSLDEDLVFEHAIKIWFPLKTDKMTCIATVVYLRLGEDNAMDMIDILWDQLQPAKIENEYHDLILDPKENFEFEYGMYRILNSAMSSHYVIVFEDILDRIPRFLISNSKSGDSSTTMIHRLCHNPSPSNINLAPNLSVSGRHSRSIPFELRTQTHSAVNHDFLRIMMRHGANIDALDRHGMTPLFLAVYRGNEHIAKLLLKAGANPLIRYKGQDILEFFEGCTLKSDRMLEILRKYAKNELRPKRT